MSVTKGRVFEVFEPFPTNLEAGESPLKKESEGHKRKGEKHEED